MSAAINNAEAATVRWLEGLKARRNVDKMGLGEKSMAAYYRYIDKYIRDLPPPPNDPIYPTHETYRLAALSWFDLKKHPAPIFPPIIDGVTLAKLTLDDKRLYHTAFQWCSNMWVHAKSRFRKLIADVEQQNVTWRKEKEDAPQNLYDMLLNSINVFRAVKPVAVWDFGTSKTKDFFILDDTHTQFTGAIATELGGLSLPIDLESMLFRAKSVLAINIVMDMCDYELTLNKGEHKLAFKERKTVYSNKYFKILATLLVHGMERVISFDKSPVPFPTLELRDGIINFTTVINESPFDFEIRWGRSMYALNFTKLRFLLTEIKPGNGRKPVDSKLLSYAKQVSAYLDGFYLESSPARKPEFGGMDPLMSDRKQEKGFSNEAVLAATANVNKVSPVAAAGVNEVRSAVASGILPNIARSAAILAAAEEAAAAEKAAAEKAAAEKASSAAEKAARNAAEQAAANAAALAARQAAEIQRFSVKPGKSCVGLNCSRRGGRRRLKKHRKTRRRSKKRSRA
jgi:hypothetical protein